MAIPSFDEWSGQARAKFPTASEEAIKQAYSLKFDGADAVRTQGPSADEFALAARQKFPTATDEDIAKAYEMKYGASAGTSVVRGFKSGFARAGQLTGALLGGLGADQFGEDVFNYWKDVGERNQPARALQGNVIDQPGLLAKPAYWGQQIGGLTGGIVNPVGYALGGAAEGADVYGRTGSMPKALAVGTADTLLNILPMGGNLGRLGRGALLGTAGAVQPAISAAATGDDVGQALKEGAGQFPAGFLLGAALPAGKRGVDNSAQAEFAARMGLDPNAPPAGAFTPEQMAAMSRGGLAPERPALPAPAAAADFAVDPAGNVMRPGESPPTPVPVRQLEAPENVGFQVDQAGQAVPMTRAQSEAGLAGQAERAALGMGEADQIAARMAAQRAMPPPTEAAPPAAPIPADWRSFALGRPPEVPVPPQAPPIGSYFAPQATNLAPALLGGPPPRAPIPAGFVFGADGQVTPISKNEAASIGRAAPAVIPPRPASSPTDAPAPAVEPPIASNATPEDDPFAVWSAQPLPMRWQKDEALRQTLLEMKGETGWYEKGGQMYRRNADGSLDKENLNRGNESTVGFTKWIPKAEWWRDKPDGMTEQEVHTAVDKALAGKKLGKRQEQVVRFMTETADERRKNAAIDMQAEELRSSGLSANATNANESAMVARAALIDESALERIAKQYEDNHNGFLTALKDFLDTQEANPRALGGGQEGRGADSGAAGGSGGGSEPTAPAERTSDRSGRVENPRRAYSRDPKYSSQHGQLALDLTFETRPNTRPEQVKVGRDALESLQKRLASGPAAGRVLGARITKDFRESGQTSLIGQRVEGPHDLATVAQVYRDPRFETLRWVLTKGGEVIHHFGTSSRLPGVAGFKEAHYQELADAMRSTGADGYYMLHNHPSGQASPSVEDRVATVKFVDRVPGFLGHVVIDHNEYSVIDRKGYFETINKDFGGYDPGKNPAIPHAVLGREIKGPRDVAALAKDLQAPKGYTTLITVNHRMAVSLITEHPTESLNLSAGERTQQLRAMSMLRRLQMASGAGHFTFAITDIPNDVALVRLFREGIVKDVIDSRTGTAYSAFKRSNGMTTGFFGEKRYEKYHVADEAKPYADGQDQFAGPREDRLDVGGGSYSLKQFGRLTDTESAVLTGVMRELEQPIKAQRRGTRTWDATEQRALQLIQQKYGITLDSLVNRKPGSTANAEQLEAYATMLSGAAKSLTEAAAEVSRTNSNESIARLAVLREKLGVMLAPAMGYRTEAGRALNILAKTAGDFRRADKLFEALGDGSADSLRGFAKKLAEADNPDQVIGVTRESYTPDWLDKLLEYRVSMGLLSGPATHSVNIASNAMFNALELGSHALAATFSKALPFEAVRARVAATVHGATIGLTNAKRAFMTEEGQITPRGKVETRPHAISGKLGKFIRIPTRALMAEDELFKSVAFHQQLSDLAMREAVAKNPRDPQAEFHRIMGDVLNRADLVDAAHTAAERLTFQDPLGPYMGMLSAAASKGSGRLVRLIIPFIRTPTNILKRAVEYTPAGYTMQAVRDALSAGGADAALAHSRIAIGSGVMLSVLALASKGLLSGAGPEDKAERDLWMREGHQPYSVKVGDQWMRYNRFDPFGTIMGIAADMYEIGHAASNDQLDKVSSMLMTSVALNLGDKSFLQGITDFANAYSDPKRYMQRWASGLATSFIPNVAAQFAREADPFQREARNVIDQARAKIPGLRENLAKRLDVAGQPQEANGTGFGSPFQATTERTDPVASAMLELGVFKSKPARDFSLQKRKVSLTDEEYEAYSGFVQQARWAQLTPMVRSPQFRQLMQQSPIRAQDLLKRAYEKIGDDAHMAFLYRNPRLVGEILSKPPTERITPSDFAARP